MGVDRAAQSSAIAALRALHASGCFVLRAARSIAATGTFDALADAATMSEMNGVFGDRVGGDRLGDRR